MKNYLNWIFIHQCIYKCILLLLTNLNIKIKETNRFVKLKIFQIQKKMFRQISEAISNRSTRVYINIYTYTSMI